MDLRQLTCLSQIVLSRKAGPTPLPGLPLAQIFVWRARSWAAFLQAPARRNRVREPIDRHGRLRSGPRPKCRAQQPGCRHLLMTVAGPQAAAVATHDGSALKIADIPDRQSSGRPAQGRPASGPSSPPLSRLKTKFFGKTDRDGDRGEMFAVDFLAKADCRM